MKKLLVARTLVGIAALSAAACGSSSSPSVKDAGGAKTPDAVLASDSRPADSPHADAQVAALDVSPADGNRPDLAISVDVTLAPDLVLVDATNVVPDAAAQDAPQLADVVATSTDSARLDVASSDVLRDAATPDTAVLPDSAPQNTPDAVVASSCDYPQCLKDLQSGCIPAGTCTMQLDLTSLSSNICFSNGVKSSTKSTLGVAGSVVTWKGSAGVCYSVEINNASTSGADLTWKNPSGTVAATAYEDFTAKTIRITCTGQAPVTLPLECDSNGGGNADAGTCAQGSCTF